MPKLKTHRGAAKRFKLTATGKLKRNRANKSHLLTCKSKKRLRRLRTSTLVPEILEDNLKKILPYA